MATSPAASASSFLDDLGLNVDGTTNCFVGPCGTDGLSDLSLVPGVNDSLFNYTTGLGTLSLSVMGIGPHTVDLFVDNAVDADFDNEFGGTSAEPALAGQSWEVDEPGFDFGNIFDNFLISGLDSTIGFLSDSPNDASMALGWNFMLAAGEVATIDFVLGTAAPSGFYLSQTNEDSKNTVYFSSSLTKSSTVPEPRTTAVLGIGLALLLASRKRRLN